MDAIMSPSVLVVMMLPEIELERAVILLKEEQSSIRSFRKKRSHKSRPMLISASPLVAVIDARQVLSCFLRWHAYMEKIDNCD
jgi:hypothetical protein